MSWPEIHVDAAENTKERDSQPIPSMVVRFPEGKNW